MSNNMKRNAKGNLYKYSSVGSYPLFYISDECNALCADCANERQDEDISAHANWENSALYCDSCSQRIESAYAEEEEDND